MKNYPPPYFQLIFKERGSYYIAPLGTLRGTLRSNASPHFSEHIGYRSLVVILTLLVTIKLSKRKFLFKPCWYIIHVFVELVFFQEATIRKIQASVGIGQLTIN